MKRYFWIFLALCLLSADISLKFYTYYHIPQMNWHHPHYPFGGVGIFQLGPLSFSLNYIQNLGAAWGMFSAYAKALVFFRISIISFLLLFLLFFNKEKKRSFPLWLIFLGAVGNILDYFFYGHVVDMLHFRFWGYTPFVFNIADSMITIGIAWLCIYSWLQSKTKETAIS